MFVSLLKETNEKKVTILSRRYCIHARETVCEMTTVYATCPGVKSFNLPYIAYTTCALEHFFYLPDQIVRLELSNLGKKARRRRRRIWLKINVFSLLLSVASRIFYKGIYAFISGIRLFLWLLGCQGGLLGPQLV